MTMTPNETPGEMSHRSSQSTPRAENDASWRAEYGQRAPWVLGTLLIVMGVVFLLDNLGIVQSRFVYRIFWPGMVLLFGLSRLVFGRGGERVFGALTALFGALWLADRLLDWDINVVRVFWPLLLIGFGIHVLTRRRYGWHGQGWGPPGPPASGNPGEPRH